MWPLLAGDRSKISKRNHEVDEITYLNGMDDIRRSFVQFIRMSHYLDVVYFRDWFCRSSRSIERLQFVRRSTKDASRRRRNGLRAEIDEMRRDVPVPGGHEDRLSQLQTVALCHAFIAKTGLFDRCKYILRIICAVITSFKFSARRALPLRCTSIKQRAIYSICGDELYVFLFKKNHVMIAVYNEQYCTVSRLMSAGFYSQWGEGQTPLIRSSHIFDTLYNPKPLYK
jgi:hypothetical protein